MMLDKYLEKYPDKAKELVRSLDGMTVEEAVYTLDLAKREIERLTNEQVIPIPSDFYA